MFMEIFSFFFKVFLFWFWLQPYFECIYWLCKQNIHFTVFFLQIISMTHFECLKLLSNILVVSFVLGFFFVRKRIASYFSYLFSNSYSFSSFLHIFAFFFRLSSKLFLLCWWHTFQKLAGIPLYSSLLLAHPLSFVRKRI